MNDSNVVAFARPPEKPPSLAFVELRLSNDDCSIEMTVRDEAGNNFVLRYKLAEMPENFDLDRLVTAWDGWRGCTGRAS